MNGSRFSWVDGDAWLIIAARAVRGSAQSAVSVLVAIYLALQGFSLVETGLLLTCGSIGASASAVVVGLFGDAFGRRRARAEVRVGRLLERGEGEHARIVDENVEPSEPRDRCGTHMLHLGDHVLPARVDGVGEPLALALHPLPAGDLAIAR